MVDPEGWTSEINNYLIPTSEGKDDSVGSSRQISESIEGIKRHLCGMNSTCNILGTYRAGQVNSIRR